MPSAFSRALPSLLLLATVGSAAGAQDAERHTLAGERVEIWNLAGRATLEAGTGREVVVELRRGGDDGARLTVEASGGRLVVRYPDRDIVYRDGPTWRGETRIRVSEDGTFTNDSDDWGGRSVRISSGGGGLEAHADLRIQVPEGQRLTLNLGVGSIEATNVNGEIELRTRSSAIVATAMKGRITARTGSGSVRIERSQVDDLIASTGSGGVELTEVAARTVRASTGSGTIEAQGVTAERVDASTGSGGVRMDGVSSADVRASTGSGRVRLDLLTTPRDLSVRTGSGGVALTLPAATNAELDIGTGSGGISTEFAVTMDNVRRNQLRGRIGTGADGRIRVTTGSGGVQLYRR